MHAHRRSGLVAGLLGGLLVVACGSSPPGAPAPEPTRTGGTTGAGGRGSGGTGGASGTGTGGAGGGLATVDAAAETSPGTGGTGEALPDAAATPDTAPADVGGPESALPPLGEFPLAAIK